MDEEDCFCCNVEYWVNKGKDSDNRGGGKSKKVKKIKIK
jgi:hypothetical protein